MTLEVEVIGVDSGRHDGLTANEVEQLCALALASAALEDGHLAVELVDEARMRELNREHRGLDTPTDVLSFPIDEDGAAAGPRELGDVVICPAYTTDLREAVVHGVLHLTGMDHETDAGEMLALQMRILSARGARAGRSRPKAGTVGARSDSVEPARGRQVPGPLGAGSGSGGLAARPVTRSGMIALAGRPNVGKSTLTNAIVGAKVAIVSDKPQTTRRAIRGVATAADWQLVLIDLPGVQRPRDALTGRMQRRVERELGDADGCLLVVNAEQGIGPGDRFIANLVRGAPVPVIIAVNKIDRCQRAGTAATLQAVAELDVGEEIFPVSARTGAGVPDLVERLVALLPESPFFFSPGQRSDVPESVWLAELVREQVLSRVRAEVPHAVEVEVEAIEQRREDLVAVVAVVLVETESQKGILIGAGGRMVKAIGTAARRAIERELGSKVHLELSVRVRRHWRGDERLLDRLGIE